jgi:hypothetical protein
VRSFGVNSVPFIFITDLCCVSALMIIFKCSPNVFLKIMMFSKGFFSKIHYVVNSYVACSVLLV